MLPILVLVLCCSTIRAASPPGDVVGKLTVGYQGWFVIPGDGSPMNHWFHWVTDENPPSPGHVKFEIYPDTREYEHLYPTSLSNFGNGQQAQLFATWDDQTVDTHVRWMQENNIDTIALQRFAGGVKTDENYRQHINGIARKIATSCVNHGRKFYIMWDVTDWQNFLTEIPEDLDRNIRGDLDLFNSPGYAHQNGKPVICVWGLGFPDRPGDNAQQVLDFVNNLKGQGLYVIGGVPTRWRTGDDSRPGFENVYFSLDMAQPWTVGRFNNLELAAQYGDWIRQDFELLSQHDVDFQPVLFPGSAWSNWNTGPRNEIPRLHGDFLWRQFVNVRQSGIPSAYIAMFDEYDEGTAIAKAAEDASMIPTDQYFLTLDADGVHVSSDFYLRLAGDGNRMMNYQIPLTDEHPTPHTV